VEFANLPTPHYIVAKTSQLLTEMQNTVNSSPVGLTLRKVATNVVGLHADS